MTRRSNHVHFNRILTSAQEWLTSVKRRLFHPFWLLTRDCTKVLLAGSCRKSNQLHEKRHREIAELLQKILEGDEETGVSSPLFSKKRKTRNSDVFEMITLKEKSNNVIATEEDSWADSSTLDGDDSEFSRPTSAQDQKENVPSKKAQKAERKLARNQSRFKAVGADDIKKVYEALHPPLDRTPLGDRTDEHGTSPGGLPNDATINANITFNTRTFRFSTLRADIHTKKIIKANGDPNRTPNSKTPTTRTPSPQDSPLVTTILLHLGVRTAPLQPHKDRKVQLARLRSHIATDLECVDNEDRETMMRMAGYWRYVNRRTYNAMVQNNQLWDWETGAKLEEIEDSEVDEGEGGEGRSLDGDTEVASPPAVVEDYGGDFELADDVETLQLMDREVHDTDVDNNEEGNAAHALPTTVKGLSFANIKDALGILKPHTNTPSHLEHDKDATAPTLTTITNITDTSTPTQATFVGVKDTRFRTTPTSSTSTSLTESGSALPTTMIPPTLSLTVPTARKPTMTELRGGAGAVKEDDEEESEGFPPLQPTKPDPNNRFSPLAIPPRPRSRPCATGATVKIVRPRTLALKIPAKEEDGKGEGSWAQVVKKGKK